MKLRPVPDPARKPYLFWCPGCDDAHVIYTAGPEPIWAVTGGIDSPTVQPDIAISLRGQLHCVITIKNGMIHYGDKSLHHLAGKTIPMIKFDYDPWSIGHDD